MKRIQLASAIAVAAALTMASCDSSKEIEFSEAGRITLTGELGQPPVTRTQIDIEPTEDGSLGIMWSVGDKIGVFGGTTENAEFEGNFTTAVTSGLFSGSMDARDNPKFAYYPYTKGCTDYKKIPVTVANIQYYTGETSIAANDIKASDTPVRASDGIYRFIFKPMVAILKFQVAFNGLAGIDADETLNAIVVKSSDTEKALTGNFTMNLAELSAGLMPVTEGTYSSIRVNLTDADGNGKSVARKVVAYASIAPCLKTGDAVEVMLLTDKHTVKFDVTALQDFKAGFCYDVPLDLSNLKPENNLQIFDPTAESPELRSFSFEVANNAGKILAREAYYEWTSTETTLHSVTSKTLELDQTTGNIEGFIPYLYDFKLIPTFTTSKGAVVTVNGQVQTSGESEVDFSSAEPVVYSVSNGLETKEYKVSVTNTGLPVVVLDINQETVNNVTSKDILLGTVNITGKEGDWTKSDVLTIYKDGVKQMTDVCSVKTRGNSSRGLPKKPVNIKLSDDISVLGMKAHDRWCLVASQFDKTMMRNAFTYHLANEIQDHFTDAAGTENVLGKGLVWNPHGETVEVVMNGIHVGTYYLCEHIKINKNRLKLTHKKVDKVLENNADAKVADCGFLIEMSTDEKENRTNTARRKVPIAFKDLDITAYPTIAEEFMAFVNDFDENLYQGARYIDNNDPTTAREYFDKAYEKLDINSMIDWWIINELAMNDEMQWPKSAFAYKDGDGKYFAGPVWDFDYQTYVNIEKYNTSSIIKNMEAEHLSTKYWGEVVPYKFTDLGGYSALMYQRTNSASSSPYGWYPWLFKDPYFVARVKARWNSLYNSVLQNQSSVIAQMGKEREKAAESNWKIWNIKYLHAGNSGDEYDFTYPEAIQNFNEVFEKRREGLNTAINNL